MKILVTAFEPFGGDKLNPSEEVLKLLPGEINGHTIVKRLLPTVFRKAGKEVTEAIEAENPDAVISLGQAGGRKGISLERVAINLRDAGIPDNEGNKPQDEKILPNGENAYFASLPLKKLLGVLKDNGYAAYISNTAGTFVCNEVMYTVLSVLCGREGSVGGFVHIPFCREQTEGREGVPFMELSDILSAIEILIGSI